MAKLNVELTGNSKAEILKELEKIKLDIEAADLTTEALEKLKKDGTAAWKVSYET